MGVSLGVSLGVSSDAFRPVSDFAFQAGGFVGLCFPGWEFRWEFRPFCFRPVADLLCRGAGG